MDNSSEDYDEEEEEEAGIRRAFLTRLAHEQTTQETVV